MDLTTFKKELSVLNNDLYFDPHHFLREKSSNPSKLKQVIVMGESILANVEEADLLKKEDRYFINGVLGNLYRILGKPQIAITLLKNNLTGAVQEKNPAKEVVSLIRLGEAFKYNDEHESAMEMFNRARILCEENNMKEYQDFVFQHMGKCLLELNRVDEAMEYFKKALSLRLIKGETSLISSTEQAIQLTKQVWN